MRRIWRIAVRVLAAIAVLLLIAAIAGVLVVRSGWFHEQVRARIQYELQRTTGGRVELGQFSFDWTNLTAQVESLVVHGKESATEQPFLRVGSVTVGLRIVSALDRDVNLASARVDRPEVRIFVYPDGSTNAPNPGGRNNQNWAENLLNLKVGRYEVNDGVFELDQRKLPLNLSGEDLRVVMNYEPAGPVYRGEVSSRRVRVNLGAGKAVWEAGLAGGFALDKDGFSFPLLHVTTKESSVDLTGRLEDVRAPRGTFDMKAAVSIKEAVQMFRLPVGPQGSAAFDGQLSVNFGSPFDFGINGRVTARGVGFVRERLKIENATVRADAQLTQDRLVLRAIRAEALESTVTGEAEVSNWQRVHMDGRVEGLGLRRAAGILTDRAVAWNGILSGPFSFDQTVGSSDIKVRANLGITPGGEGIPVEGQLDAAYDQAAGTVGLGSSWIATPATRLDFSGTLGQTLRVQLRTSNPDDLLPAIEMVQTSPPTALPLKLNNGSAIADGTVTGPLDNPRFAGQVTVTNGVVEGHGFDRFTAQVEAAKSEVLAQRLTLARGATEVTGSAGIAAREESFEDGTLTAALNVRNADIAPLVREWGNTSPLTGVASATIRVAGTVKNPEAEIVADVAGPEAYGERIDRLRATVRYKADSIEVASGEVTDGSASVRFGGSYRRTGSDWKSGEASFDAATQNMPMTRIEQVVQLKPPVDGVLTGRVRGTAQVSNGELILRAINADLAAERVTIDQQVVGNVALGVETKGTELQVLATGRVRESTIEGRGTWTLAGNHPGSATLRFSRISIASLHQLSMLGRGAARAEDVPFEGFVEGGATVSVPLRALGDVTAQVALDTVQVNPKPNQALRLGVQPQDIVLKNERPVLMDVNSKEIRLRQAEFTGRDTSLRASGAIPLKEGSNADLAVRGNVNLILLQLFNPDLLARGDAAVDASVRGSLQNPAVNGRLTLKGASLYFSDLPNGIDNANGTILFDRNRATIEKLSAETGGGSLALTGIVEFAGRVFYRLQATAQQVRVRWEDVSTTFNARLALNGTPESSTLSGTITLTRSAFNPRTDLGQLLASASRPTPAPSAPNEYLRGLQFDVRIESGPNFGFETSLTRDVEAEVDLNLHGTPLRPVLLGTMTVNQGEVELFGNRYTIDRGEVRFLNPVKIEPTFDLDLATKARGITVNISLTGTPQHPNLNYSSDPPLQPGEIIALLAVGRDPASTRAGMINTPSSGGLSQAGSGLLGQAVSAQVSSRLQRFFGASRVKIDPTLTGVDNLPQARLTIEQQVSKDITLTYITNLNRTQEQLVRVQWDLNRNWSAIAIRDPSGLFGIDFQYRKRY